MPGVLFAIPFEHMPMPLPMPRFPCFFRPLCGLTALLQHSLREKSISPGRVLVVLCTRAVRGGDIQSDGALQKVLHKDLGAYLQRF